MTQRYYLGIDPGVRTGYAIWDAVDGSFVEVSTLPMTEALFKARTFVEAKRTEGLDTILVVEDARQRRWIPRGATWRREIGRAMGAGSVKRDSQVWGEWAKACAVEVFRVPPRKGMTKWSADTFAAVTRWTKRCSNHARDAALLVWGRTPEDKGIFPVEG